MIRIKDFGLLLSALFGASAYAGTYTAASCNYSDVNAVIKGPTHIAVAGDTIIIPAGTCTWTSELSITVGLDLTGSGTPNTGASTFGAGTSSTTIVDNAGSSSPMIRVSGISYGQTVKIELLNIYPYSATTSLISPIFVAGGCTSTGCAQLRIDNVNFGGAWTSGNGSPSTWMIRTDNVFGVLDHNTIGPGSAVALANVHHSVYLGVGLYGDNSWAQPDSFGTASALYMENNSINTGAPSITMNDCDAAPGTTGGGCRIAARYNQITSNGAGPIAYIHGTETTQRVRGGRQIEVYNNTINCTNTSAGCQSADAVVRSGVVLAYSNTITTSSGSWYDSLVEMDAYRTFAGFSPWGWCDGTGGYDDNDGTVYALGTITGVSTSGGTLVVTDTSKSWSANEWVNNEDPYSIVDTTIAVGFEITAGSSDTVSAANYSQNFWNSPRSPSIGDSYQILRSSICIDQPSRSGSTYLSGSTPSPAGWVNEALDPSYEWNDNTSGATFFGAGKAISTDTSKLINNRDYYYQGASFNGTTGTGTGLLSSRPTTCTPRVAYWATDTSTLYQCSATNTWTAYYAPYAYPHPLTKETGQGTGTDPGPPTNLQAIAH